MVRLLAKWNTGCQLNHDSTHNDVRKKGVMDIFHAGIGPKAIYCLYLQGINAMNQKTALFVVTNIQRRMDAN